MVILVVFISKHSNDWLYRLLSSYYDNIKISLVKTFLCITPFTCVLVSDNVLNLKKTHFPEFD